MRALFSIIFSSFILFSCTEDRHFEENQDFKNRVWGMEESVRFEFEIDSVEIPYQVMLNIRNTMDYPYRNLYIKYHLRDSTHLLKDKLLNIKLFEAKSGKPYGKNQSDIFSHQLLVEDSVYFPEKGKYTVELQQYMREKELLGIVSAGIRIEEIK